MIPRSRETTIFSWRSTRGCRDRGFPSGVDTQKSRHDSYGEPSAGEKGCFRELSPTPTPLSHGSNTTLCKAIQNSCGRREADLPAAQG